jgi:hypothetical protein
MNNNKHFIHLEKLIFEVKQKITDLEYYNIMETMKQLSHSPRVYVPPAPSWSASSSQSNSSQHISSVCSSSSASSDICY